ncbi:MAG: GAF domain-containing protein [Miltoncostaeaceae bacterium]
MPHADPGAASVAPAAPIAGLSPAEVNLLRRADAAGQRLFRELVTSRIAWATVREVSRLVALDVVGVSLRAHTCDHPSPCLLETCEAALEMRAVVGNRTPRLPGLRLASGAGLAGRVLDTGRVASVADYQRAAPGEAELVALTAGEEGIRALACVPLSFAGVVRGVLHVGRRRSGELPEATLEAFGRIATYAGAALAAAGDRARVEEVAAARERRRLTRILHDDLAQRLFSAGVSARVARERAATGHPDLMGQLMRVEQEVARTGAALRALMRGLDNADTPASTLAVTLSEDIAGFQRRTDVTAHLIVLGEGPPVEAGRTQVLVQAVREGLRNVERHAQAGEVVVSLCVDATGAEVAVQDDGVGPGTGPAAGDGTGLGLSGLREELARLGGGLRLSRNDDLGTTLRVWIPPA